MTRRDTRIGFEIVVVSLSLSLFVITIKTYPMDLTEIDLSFGAIAKRFACKRKSILPLTLKLIIIINVFYCEVRANVTPYTIRNKSLGLIRRVHRDDTRSVRRGGPIVDWREENQRVERTEDLENLRSSINTNKSLNLDLSSLYDVAKNITKADNKTTGGELTNHTRFKRGVIHLYNMVVCATGCNPLVYKGYGCYCGFLGSGYVIDGIDRCCKMHDWCYDATECPIFMEYIAPYYWRCYHGHKPVCAVEHGKWGGSGSCAQRLCECDRSLAECLRRYPCPTTKAVCTSSPWRLVQNLFMIM